MENLESSSRKLIARVYTAMFAEVVRYINYRVTDYCEAENLAQDVFVKLLEYDKELSEKTVKALVYTVARNIVNDHLRHVYRATDATDYLRENAPLYETDVESEVSARDIALRERMRVERLPRQRRIIYVMSRYFEKSIADISEKLSLSARTVENHLRLSRRDVRDYMAMVI